MGSAQLCARLNQAQHKSLMCKPQAVRDHMFDSVDFDTHILWPVALLVMQGERMRNGVVKKNAHRCQTLRSELKSRFGE